MDSEQPSAKSAGRYKWLLGVLALVGLGFLLWIGFPKKTTITYERFVHSEEQSYYKFRINNSSWTMFSVAGGEHPPNDDILYGWLHTSMGFRDAVIPKNFGLPNGTRSIPPRSTIELRVPYQSGSVDEPFKLGIEFTLGTPTRGTGHFSRWLAKGAMMAELFLDRHFDVNDFRHRIVWTETITPPPNITPRAAITSDTP